MSGERVRYQQTGEFHFLTFRCYHRRAYLSPAATKELFEDALERVRLRYLFVVAAYVVMPEHVHLLVNEPRRALLSKAVQALKVSMRSSQRPFWQAHYQSVFHICRSGFGRFPETRFDCGSHPWRFRILLIYETRSMTSTSSHTRNGSKSCATSIAIPSGADWLKSRRIGDGRAFAIIRRACAESWRLNRNGQRAKEAGNSRRGGAESPPVPWCEGPGMLFRRNSYCNRKSNSRFPSGMTTRKAKAAAAVWLTADNWAVGSCADYHCTPG